MISSNVIILAFVLTTFAGLTTVLGGILACFSKKPNKDFLALSLGLAAGIMLYIAFIELFPEGKEHIMTTFDETISYVLASISFFLGFLFMVLIEERTHVRIDEKSDEHLLKIGMLTALAIAIHNFPEGIATFIATISDSTLGINTALAVAIHNIPVGMAIAIPIYYATNNKGKAIKFTALAGMAEPLGALVTYLVLMPFINDTILGFIFSFVSGMMIYIAVFELIKHSFEYKNSNKVIIGFMLGMFIMAVSMVML